MLIAPLRLSESISRGLRKFTLNLYKIAYRALALRASFCARSLAVKMRFVCLGYTRHRRALLYSLVDFSSSAPRFFRAPFAFLTFIIHEPISKIKRLFQSFLRFPHFPRFAQFCKLYPIILHNIFCYIFTKVYYARFWVSVIHFREDIPQTYLLIIGTVSHGIPSLILLTASLHLS